MSALPPKAGMDWDCRDVRFVPRGGLTGPSALTSINWRRNSVSLTFAVGDIGP